MIMIAPRDVDQGIPDDPLMTTLTDFRDRRALRVRCSDQMLAADAAGGLALPQHVPALLRSAPLSALLPVSPYR